MDWQATLDGRSLHLTDKVATRLSVALDEGGRYRIIVPELAELKAILAALESLPLVGVLPANGGLLGAKTVSENFALALHFGQEQADDAQDVRDEELQRALRLAGLPATRLAGIGREQPMNLTRPERWLLGFARCLVLPPELLVFDRAFAGLARREADMVVACAALYAEYHPFRPVMFIDLDTHELPSVGHCRGELRLSEAQEAECPC